MSLLAADFRAYNDRELLYAGKVLSYIRIAAHGRYKIFIAYKNFIPEVDLQGSDDSVNGTLEDLLFAK